MQHTAIEKCSIRWLVNYPIPLRLEKQLVGVVGHGGWDMLDKGCPVGQWQPIILRAFMP